MRRSALAFRLVATLIVALAMVRVALPPDVIAGAAILLIWIALCGVIGLASGSRLAADCCSRCRSSGRWYRVATGRAAAGDPLPLLPRWSVSWRSPRRECNVHRREHPSAARYPGAAGRRQFPARWCFPARLLVA
ncbi:MAG: hypothetical protein U0841_31170 [Chloroflexia bacterium]